MLNTVLALRGMAVAPHALAAQSGLAILRDGGNAIEAAVGMAASLAVLYPHMSGIGGDGFWLIAAPGERVLAIDASGRAPGDLQPADYRLRSFAAIPVRGPMAANTVAGTLSGWQAALALSAREWGGKMPLSRLLEDAIVYAQAGSPVTASQAASTADKLGELGGQPGFASVYLDRHKPPEAGSLLRQPALGATLRHLAGTGLDDFYRGELASALAAQLAAAGSPVGLADLQAHRAFVGSPLALQLGEHLPAGRLYAVPPPSQGLATLLIIGQFAYASAETRGVGEADYVHFLVEATKNAFRLRDRWVRDPLDMTGVDLAALLTPPALRQSSVAIDMHQARAWAGAGDPGDTTWFGAIDGEGRAVSTIQSLFYEFGSGVVLEDTGVCWHNRGTGFSLEAGSPRYLAPGRKPFHTLCPSLARLDDGRLMVFGTMGGEGQPQTQAAVFTRHLARGMSLQRAISEPRWLLGRSWGAGSNTLKLEARFSGAMVADLMARGHEVERVDAYDPMMGHAGAICRQPGGLLEGAADPRGDGCAAGY